MSPSSSTGPGIETGPGGIAGTSTTPLSAAERGAIVRVIREGSPEAIRQQLAALEAEGRLEREDVEIADEAIDDHDLLEMEAELDLADEDIFQDEGEQTWERALTLDNSLEDASPFPSSRFELLVTERGCVLPNDEWHLWRPVDRDGAAVLYELGEREATLNSIARWLSRDRADFLSTRDLWALGANALAEARSGVVPVEQKSLLNTIDHKVSEASFSRYIRATSIVWPTAECPLAVLFEKQAKMAWAGSAVRQFLEEAEEPITEDVLRQYQSVTGKRDKQWRETLKRQSVDAMDLPTFIQFVNLCASTRWSDVLNHYSDRICREAE